ncbi:MAG: hypothetical protein QOG77_3757 [Solirubrobacteraceae bacterium]|jgi:hypothetical protein|nr:hypothetical protein [Solirubrobacteraceae bacterium]
MRLPRADERSRVYAPLCVLHQWTLFECEEDTE